MPAPRKHKDSQDIPWDLFCWASIGDERNIDIWHLYILFFDEMGYASKANVDTIKHVIMATHLSRRPMRTNTKVSVAQKATFIECSNKTLAQLIKDQGPDRHPAFRQRAVLGQAVPRHHELRGLQAALALGGGL